jgi:hypothetical protein
LTFSCAIVASPRLTSPAIVETLKPCAASNGPVTPLRPAPASKLTARRRSALRRIVGTGRMRRVCPRLRWRDGAGGFFPGLCTAGSRSSGDKRPGTGEGSCALWPPWPCQAPDGSRGTRQGWRFKRHAEAMPGGGGARNPTARGCPIAKSVPHLPRGAAPRAAGGRLFPLSLVGA